MLKDNEVSQESFKHFLPRKVSMLVLTRKLGESIAIGDDIKVTIIEVKGKQVRIGIEAPQQTVVHREEIYQRCQYPGC